MQVFELYIRRLFKRKGLLIFMLLMPILFAYLLVKAFEPSFAPEMANMLNSIIGVLIILTTMNTMLFYGDRQYATDQRILLSTHSKFSYYCQIVAVFLAIGTVQLIEVMLFTNTALHIELPLTGIDYLIILLAYAMLNIIAAGLGFIIMNYSRTKSMSLACIVLAGLLLAVMGGMFLPREQLPFIVKDVAAIFPTYWLNEVVVILLGDVHDQIYPLVGYLLGLMLYAGATMLLLTRTRTKRI